MIHSVAAHGFEVTSSKGNWQVISPTPPPFIHEGIEVWITGAVLPLHRPRFPGDKDQVLYARAQGLSGFVKLQSCNNRGLSWGLPWCRFWLAEWRQQLTDFSISTLPSPYGILLVSFVLGNRTVKVPADIQSQFKQTGLTHTLVVSGSQVSLIMGSLVWLLKRSRLPRGVQLLMFTASGMGFWILTGGGPSVVRALLMAGLVFLLYLLGRNPHPIQLLLVTAFVMVVFNPFCLTDYGFLLSFLATFSLLMGIPGPNWLSVVVSPFIWTLPVVWLLSHQISLMSICLNACVLVVVEAVVVVGMISFFLVGVIPFLASIGAHFCGVCLMGITKVVHLAALVPVCVLPPLSVYHVLLLELGLLLFFFSDCTLKKGGALLVGATLIWVFLIPWIPGPLRIWVLDVGQGDAILIESPHHQFWLLDTGKEPYWEQVLRPTFAYLGVQTLSGLVLSHPDTDHTGGLQKLLRHCALTAVYTADEPLLMSQVREEHVPLFTVSDGVKLRVEPGLELEVLNPPKQARQLGLKDNDRSVVIRLRYGAFSMLMTGDLEESQEIAMLSKNGAHVRSQVLKVGHHGSKTSSSLPFLKAVSPQYAIISVGKNTYGHPNPTVLQRLLTQHCSVFRTDLQGSIYISSDGKQMTVKTL